MKGMNDLKNFDLQEFIDSLQNLDPENIGSWPTPVKIFIYVAVFAGVLLLGWMLNLSSIDQARQAGEREQQTLLTEFEAKVFKAQNLDVYKAQLKEMEDSFGALLRQLPQDTEVPGLLEDITHTGLGSGLEFEAIDLGKEQPKDFYVEQPIDIKVRGDYHAFGAFVSGIAALPRIVTLHNFKIVAAPNARQQSMRDVDGSPVLLMTIKANTYRYNDAPASPDKAKDAKAGGAK